MSLLVKKIVCVTGSSRGIGRACAVECAKHGAAGLILHYYGDESTTKEIQSLKEDIETTYIHTRVVTVPGDIAERDTSKKVQKELVSFSRRTSTQSFNVDRERRRHGVQQNRYQNRRTLPCMTETNSRQMC